jgi:hypothetical protein
MRTIAMTPRERQEKIDLAKRMLEPKIQGIFQKVAEKYALEYRPADEGDFRWICEDQGINLASGPEFAFMAEGVFGVQGCLMRFRGGTRAIWLKSFFVGGPIDLAVAFHELGHYFCRHEGGHLLMKTNRVQHLRNEIEADLFSEICLRPRRR